MFLKITMPLLGLVEAKRKVFWFINVLSYFFLVISTFKALFRGLMPAFYWLTCLGAIFSSKRGKSSFRGYIFLKKARENPRLGVDIHKKACDNPRIGCDFHQWTNSFRGGLKNLWSRVCTTIWSSAPPGKKCDKEFYATGPWCLVISLQCIVGYKLPEKGKKCAI